MKSYLKTKTVEVEGVGKIEIQEMSAKVQLELIEANRAGKMERTASMICKGCVIPWQSESLEDIETNVPGDILTKLATKVYELSGIDLAKNSDPAPSDSSSTP